LRLKGGRNREERKEYDKRFDAERRREAMFSILIQ